MPDITMCIGYIVIDGHEFICPRRELCYRYKAEPTPHWQAYSTFYDVNEKEPCSHYEPIGKEATL